MIEPTASQRRRVERAIAEIAGEVTDPIPQHRMIAKIGEAMTRYLGPAIGMTELERWELIGVVEIEALLEALEERSALMHDGPMFERVEGAA